MSRVSSPTEMRPDAPTADEPSMSDPAITAFLTKVLCAHGGRLALSEIQQRLSLSPAHIAGILREEAHRFLQLEPAGGVLVLSPVRLCKNYLNDKCRTSDCGRLHLCRHFVLGKCFHRSKGNTCGFSHNIQSEVNMAVLKANNLSNLDERDLQVLLLLNDPSFLPEVCKDYKSERREETCQNGVSCQNLHICGFFTRGQCQNSPCNRSHRLLDPNVLRVLEARGFSKEMSYNIQLMRTHQCMMARKEPRIMNPKGHSRSSRNLSSSREGRRRCQSNERVPRQHLRIFSAANSASQEVYPDTAAPLAMFIRRNSPVAGSVAGSRVRSLSTPPAPPLWQMQQQHQFHHLHKPINPYCWHL